MRLRYDESGNVAAKMLFANSLKHWAELGDVSSGDGGRQEKEGGADTQARGEPISSSGAGVGDRMR